MAAVNIVNVTSINGFNLAGAVTTSATDVIDVPADVIYKINTILIANVDGTNAADVTVQITKAPRTSAATGASISGATFKIASTVSVPADAVLVLSDTPIYLEEGDTLKGGASANSDLTLFVSYDVLDD